MDVIDTYYEKIMKSPDQDIYVWKGKVFRTKSLHEQILIANSMIDDNGISAGDCVAVIGDYSPRTIAYILALAKCRAVIIPLLTTSYELLKQQLKNIPVDFHIIESETGIEIIAQNVHTPKERLVAELCAANEPGLVMFTSGTTGKPKGVVHNMNRLFKKFLTPRPTVRTVNFLLFDHWGGLNTLFHSLINGGFIVFPITRKPDYIASIIQDFRLDLLPVTPSFLNHFIISGVMRSYDLSSLSMISYGAEPMPLSTLRALSKMLPKIEFRQTFGMIELGVLRSKSRSNNELWVKMGGDGYEVRVVENILQIKSDSAMLGYLGEKGSFTEDGFFITGDVVETDGEWLKILGRQDEVINVGGEKVYPNEVETVLLEHDLVENVRVYGEHNPIIGKIVCAEIKAVTGADNELVKSDLRKLASENLKKFMRPVKITFSEAIAESERFKKIRI